MNNSDAPAYPDNWDAKLPGLTKREYFAAMAMQGFSTIPYSDSDEMCANSDARRAVLVADALLKELEK
jgi:hypothetical protein